MLRRHLLHPALDHIADAHNAGQPAINENRNVAHPVIGHQRSQVVHPIIGTAGHHHDTHDVRHRPVHQVGSAFVQLAQHVALGHDADHPVSANHHQRTDVEDGQLSKQFGHRGRRGDRRHRRSLAAQNVRDTHSYPPPAFVVMDLTSGYGS